MNLLIPLAIGAVVLIASQSNSTTPSAKKDEKKDGGGLVLDSQIVKPIPTADLKLPITCKPNQYYDEKTKKCVDFWIPGETDALVESHILAEVAKIYNKPDLGNAYVAELCQDKWTGDPLTGSWVANPNQMAVVKTVIHKIWGVSMNDLPPTKDHPKWLHEMWNAVLDVYGEIICMNEK